MLPATPPTAAQVDALNRALQNVGSVRQFAIQDLIRAIPETLLPDEIPELVLAVEYKGTDACLLVATNQRFMFIKDGFFPFSKKKVTAFWNGTIAEVEWHPGRARHRITIRMGMGRKKEECYGLWGEKFQSRKMAEHLASKVAGGSGSIAKDPATVKTHAIDDLNHETVLPARSADLKRLQGILEEDEMPEQLFSDVEHDDRNGLNVASTLNPFGLLAISDRRLIFLNKEPLSKLRVESFPYDTIERVEFTKGIMFGSVTIWTNGRVEKFDKLASSEVEGLVEALRERTGVP
jgi:hypothetical protein